MMPIAAAGRVGVRPLPGELGDVLIGQLLDRLD